MERREFIHTLERAALGACVALPLFASGCASANYVQGIVDGGTVRVPLTSLAADGTALVEVPGIDLPLYVRRTAPGRAVALSTRCMHRGCQVEPEPDRLACPCHGSEYSLEGAVLKGPTERPLTRFGVVETAEALVISLAPVGAS
jgi:cytochrome b6-f complex iron-sulfur subunit